MDKKVFKLVHSQAKQGAIACINSPDYDGYVVTIQEPTRNLEQNSKIHVVISLISKKATFQGEHLDTEDWKRLLIDGFVRIKATEGQPIRKSGKVVPSLDGSGIVQLGLQSRSFSKEIASEFIEYLNAYAVSVGVDLKDTNYE